MLDKGAHEGEHIGVVGGGGQHQLSVAECVCHSLRHVAPGQIVHDDLRAAAQTELFGQQLGGLAGVAVNGGVGDHHAVALHRIGRPGVVQLQRFGQIVLHHRAVQGADLFDIQRCGLLEQVLHLRAVLAHDADIVAPGLVRPVLAHVQRAELAETVGGEQHLFGGFIADHDLRPVHHGREHEGQGMFAQ